MIKLEIPREKIVLIRTIEGRKFKEGFWYFPDSSLPKLQELKLIESDFKAEKPKEIEFELSNHLRDYQKMVVNKALNNKQYGIFADTGLGKCHGKGTEVLMYDGTYKKVENIIIGDLLMGDDSTPREVLSLARGQEKMYRVIPNKGEPFVCNESHILSLRATSNKKNKFTKGQIINISIKDYLKQNNQFKHYMKLYKKPVEFEDKKVYFPPYLIGLWLGDGICKSPQITNADEEIINYLKDFSKQFNFEFKEREGHNCKEITFTHGKGSTCNELNVFLQSECYVDNQKRISKKYLYNSREKRLELLAGIIDTDGCLTGNCYEVTTKYEKLKDDIVYLCGSLGFMATSREKISRINSLNFEGTYYNIIISGDIDKIPCKVKRKQAKPRKQIKNVLNVGFKLEYLGGGNYYGFTITGNHLYFLKDFWITHNTHIGLEIAKHHKKTLIVSPLSIIETAWIDDCKKYYSNLKIINLWQSSKKKRLEMLNKDSDIYIINFDGLKIIIDEIKEKGFDCIIVDESSKMKNLKSQITQTLLSLVDYIPNRFILSGCPTPNNNSEIFPQMKFINSEIFGNNYYGFLARYFTQDMKNPHRWFQTDSNKDAYFNRLSQQSIFLKKEDILDLPEKTFLIREVLMNKEQEKYYNNMLQDIKDNINNWSKFEFTAKLMKLREICSGFVINKDNTITEFKTNKDTELENVIEEIGDKPIIIWCQFINEIERLAEKFNGVALTSKTKNRDDIIRDFKNNKIKLLFVHPKLLGMGVTFTNCSYNIYYSQSYSYEEFKQSQDRIHRIGQTNNCTYIILQCKNTIDKKIYKCLQNKKNAIDELYLEMSVK